MAGPEEATVEFTHDRDLPWLLPGVAPTHRRASVLAISVVSIRHSRITSHRTLWDHTTLLGQLQLTPPTWREVAPPGSEA